MPKISRNVIAIWCIALMLLLSACVKRAKDISEDTSIFEIMSLAEIAKKEKRFKDAGELFMKVDTFYPYSDQSRNALVEAMKAFHVGGELDDARLAAKRYLLLYPKGKEAVFAKYMIGLTYFDAIVDVQRDQGAASFAVREFEQLVAQYPNSAYSTMAKSKFQAAYDQLAGQEMSVGRFYLYRDNYLAAINRFQTVIDKYSQTVFAVEAYYRLAEAYAALGMKKEFNNTKSQLTKKFPKSKWTDALARLSVSDQQ